MYPIEKYDEKWWVCLDKEENCVFENSGIMNNQIWARLLAAFLACSVARRSNSSSSSNNNNNNNNEGEWELEWKQERNRNRNSKTVVPSAQAKPFSQWLGNTSSDASQTCFNCFVVDHIYILKSCIILKCPTRKKTPELHHFPEVGELMTKVFLSIISFWPWLAHLTASWDTKDWALLIATFFLVTIAVSWWDKELREVKMWFMLGRVVSSLMM